MSEVMAQRRGSNSYFSIKNFGKRGGSGRSTHRREENNELDYMIISSR